MADPVSWLLIEPGWRVVASDGNEVGRVEAVTGDSNADIFDGLAVASGLLARPKYVPAERVGAIVEGQVALTVTREELDALGEYDEPAEAVDVDPDSAPTRARAEQAVEGADPHEHRVGLLRRIASWLGMAGRR
jgi:hypothetical protein